MVAERGGARAAPGEKRAEGSCGAVLGRTLVVPRVVGQPLPHPDQLGLMVIAAVGHTSPSHLEQLPPGHAAPPWTGWSAHAGHSFVTCSGI